MITLEKSTLPLKTIFWKQIFLLLALESATTIGWFAYEKYQPVLLDRFSFQKLTALLVIAQGLLGAILHPVSGNIADKMLAKYGSKFQIIISGIAFAAIIFMAVSITILTDVHSPIRWILPFLVFLWLAAMSTFSSPAISLVESFAPKNKIPEISALLVIFSGTIYAIGPFLLIILNTLGLSATFVLGGLLIVISGYTLKSSTEQDKIYYSHNKHRYFYDKIIPNPAILSISGFFVGLCKATILLALPVFFEKTLHLNQDYVQAAIMFSAVAFSMPISKEIKKYGARKILILGSIGSIALFSFLFLTNNTIIHYLLIVGFGILYSTMAVSSLPFILERVPDNEAGSGVGLYYGGVAAATASVSMLMLG